MICQLCKQDKDPDQFHTGAASVCDDCQFDIDSAYWTDQRAGELWRPEEMEKWLKEQDANAVASEPSDD